MAEHELITAKYFKPDDEASTPATSPAAQEPLPPRVSSLAAWSRATRWISIVAGVAIFACVIVIAIPPLRTAVSTKANSPVDWIVRLCGGRTDKMFENWMREHAESNQREWQERYKESTFHFDPQKPIEFPLQSQANFK